MKFVFDIDGTICTHEKDYSMARPYQKRITKINKLHNKGHHICLFTARGSETGLDWRKITENQLLLWDVRYDVLLLGKPAADFYVDDKGINDKDFNWEYEQEEICL